MLGLAPRPEVVDLMTGNAAEGCFFHVVIEEDESPLRPRVLAAGVQPMEDRSLNPGLSSSARVSCSFGHVTTSRW